MQYRNGFLQRRRLHSRMRACGLSCQPAQSLELNAKDPSMVRTTPNPGLHAALPSLRPSF